jgi:hypothetical protein
MKNNAGLKLLLEVFGEDLEEEIMDLNDINYLSGVTQWNRKYLHREGNYTYIEVTFVYKGEQYRFECKSYNSGDIHNIESDLSTFTRLPKDIWIVVAVKPHYPSVHHFHSEKEARDYYEHAKDNGFVVHLSKVEEYHYDDECHGYGQEREDDIKTWDVYWS